MIVVFYRVFTVVGAGPYLTEEARHHVLLKVLGLYYGNHFVSFNATFVFLKASGPSPQASVPEATGQERRQIKLSF